MSAYAQRLDAPIETGHDENPYKIHSELQDTMQELVGIIRRRDELEEALARLERLRARAARASVTGSRVYNPGWHLALDLENLIGVSEAVTRSALIREESRGGHTREDFPKPDAEWGTKNVVIRKRDGRLVITTEPIPKVPAELSALLGEDKPSGEAATGAKTAVAAGDD
jgi:succinate dehydrogenase / fumarate reductase flavoprotein subunit